MSGCCTALYNSSRLECFHYYAQIHCWVFSQSRTVSLLDIVSLTCLKTKQSGKVATPRLFCVLLVWKQSRMVNCSCLFCVFKKKSKNSLQHQQVLLPCAQYGQVGIPNMAECSNRHVCCDGFIMPIPPMAQFTNGLFVYGNCPSIFDFID